LSILDRYSPQTPITEDEKRAGPWFQRWLSQLGAAVDPDWIPYTPFGLTGGSVTQDLGCVYRDRGNSVELSLFFKFHVSAAATNTITISAPKQYDGFGVFSAVWSLDFATYQPLSAYYNGLGSASVVFQTINSTAFPIGDMWFAVSGSHRRK
jgi:hypothetical protein